MVSTWLQCLTFYIIQHVHRKNNGKKKKKYLHVHREGVQRLFSKFVSSEINTTQETSFIPSNICTAVVEIFECHFWIVLNSSFVHGHLANQYRSLFDYWQWMISIFIFQWYLEWEVHISYRLVQWTLGNIKGVTNVTRILLNTFDLHEFHRITELAARRLASD